MKTGGQLIVEALEANGTDRIFCVPGESYLAVLDALHDSSIRTIVCRQEGGAAMMADCQGRLTGKPGICFVTRGPGATNSSAGVHIAMQDSVPMILFIGQVASHAKEREAFQEVDYKRFFGDIAKWVVEIDDAARIPEFVTRAFAVATSGRPGPVVISLPEDMLTSEVEAPSALPHTPVETRPGEAELDALQMLLANAKRPFAILGGTRWNEEAVAHMRAIAETWSLPVGCSFRRQMLFDHLHPNYAGDVGIGINPKLAERIKQADVVLLIGGRLGEMPSSDYTLLKSPYPDQALVHVHADAGELGRVYRPTIAINASPTAFVEAFAKRKPAARPSWAAEAEKAHAAYLEWSTPPQTGPGAVQMGPIIEHLGKVLPEDAILTNGAGNYATWVHRFYRNRRFGTQAAPTSGSMGYGTPAAVAAKSLYPDRMVVAFAGDGCFLMNGQEFATAVQYDLPIIVIVVNNGIYGTIRMHQEREYPSRVVATTLKNPDFAALARSYGGHGETVEKTANFAPAFERALASGKPTIIEIRLDPEAITPTRTLTQIRDKS
ncbi:thiamine pyrophosphate-binding protein [Mesorhizobium sp. M2D.F.Ca.ET.185.01.1.1]|uniref:thiamine pyrophosphate-binding protein n=2 Tax=Mesorhizobium TaxID=68287 RepID=UPI000FCC7E21|nr:MULTISPECIES: thiamine pyrophosphate-binding protein [unclassified Mesorhizobium]TGP54881.1 thiamine pyrophosphate-binding protein [bacterium M00.F.Ca.ET.230.01.1.1]TGP80456.1 thiamine pyrophosphate-binding protein [bacterium M00.F.Ca.ET.227.01.1.1]TGQ00575.1 thiamine pyrophosphate-binding protein [bacterium M00.F.Ca.ET.221.01.1.1]TGQ02903.1 thiamine pyrophosphate-binding protein [bacterium M00.F.Ca.ET.222.01.1.1]TGU09294.1 thiamine pyrophosphate-binding protein [bacterium M00.F.Ca.ET.163.0